MIKEPIGAIAYEIMVPELIGPHMPLSDIAGVIARLCEGVPEALMFGTESNLANDHAGNWTDIFRSSAMHGTAHTPGWKQWPDAGCTPAPRVRRCYASARTHRQRNRRRHSAIGRQNIHKAWPLRRTILSVSLAPWKRGSGSGHKLTAVHHWLTSFASACEVSNSVTALCALRQGRQLPMRCYGRISQRFHENASDYRAGLESHLLSTHGIVIVCRRNS